MKTFSNQISAYAKRSRNGEKSATLRIIQNMMASLDGSKWDQARRIIAKGKSAQQSHTPTTGIYSGLTRNELAASGTCEPDWF